MNTGIGSNRLNRQSLRAELLDALLCQSHALHALVMRETRTRYGEHKLGFLWALLEPTLVVAVFVVLFSAISYDSPSGMPLIPFMIVGIASYSFFRDPMTQLQSSIAASRQLLAFPQISTFDVMASRVILESLILSFVFAFLLVAVHLMGHTISIQRPLEVLAGCGLLLITGVGLGFFFASLVPIIPSIRQFVTAVLGRPLFMGSGLFFTAESMPNSARDLLLYNPILHCMELIRSAFFVEFESRYGSWEYASICAFAALALGMLTHAAMHRRAVIGL